MSSFITQTPSALLDAVSLVSIEDDNSRRGLKHPAQRPPETMGAFYMPHHTTLLLY